MTEQTDTPAVLTAAEIAAIAERLARIPGGDWHSALGSGHSAMTTVMADVPDGDDDYEPVFICDVIPDFRVEDPQVWKNRVPLLEFIANAPTDMQWLIDRLAAAEQRAARSAQTIDGLIRERDAAEQRATDAEAERDTVIEAARAFVSVVQPNFVCEEGAVEERWNALVNALVTVPTREKGDADDNE